MSHPPPTSPGGSGGPPSPEKRALLEAYDEALKSRPTDARPRGPRRGPHPATWLSLLVLAGVLGYLWMARPDWVFHRGMPAQSAAVREASLRLAMALQYQRIARFQDSAGHLPARLADTGIPVGNLTYTPTQFGEFVLEGADSELHLTLRSGDSVAAFVGNSYDVLSRRGTP